MDYLIKWQQIAMNRERGKNLEMEDDLNSIKEQEWKYTGSESETIVLRNRVGSTVSKKSSVKGRGDFLVTTV